MNQNLVDKFASVLSSDVLSSYTDLEAVLGSKNIVPGSFAEYRTQCTDMERVQLNSSNGQLFTRLRLGPAVNCTHPTTNQIRWEFTIPANSIGVQLYPHETQSTFTPTNCNTLGFNGSDNVLRFWIGYANAAQIASEVAITYQGAVPGWDSGLFNEEHTMLAQHSLSNAIHENSVTLTSIDALFEKSSSGCGTIIEIPLQDIHDAGGVTLYTIPTPITISGIIDLNQLNPIFNHFPIMTPAFNNVWLRLRMNNFLRSLVKVPLDKINAGTGKYIPIQFTPPEKPDVIIINTNADVANPTIKLTGIPAIGDGTNTWEATAETTGKTKALVDYLRGKDIAITTNMKTIVPRRFLMRLINAGGHTAGVPNQPISALPNVQFNIMESVQQTYQLEDQEQVDNMLRSKGFFAQPTRFFRSMKFNNLNLGVDGNQLQTVTGIANISKFFVTFNYRPEYPLYLPNPLLVNVNPLWKNRPILPAHDTSVDKNAAYRIFNCFVDVDLVSPPTALYDSIMFKNREPPNQEHPYGSTSLHAATGLMITGTNRPTYMPNQFTYAIDMSGGCYLRGVNVVGKDYDGTAQFQMQISESADKVNGTADQNTWLQFVNSTQASQLSKSPGTSALHCLVDGIIKFYFGPDGKVSEIRVDGGI